MPIYGRKVRVSSIDRTMTKKQKKTKPNEYDAFVKQKCCIYGSHSGLTGRKSPNPEMAKMKPTKKKHTRAHTISI